jgi:hypothetical protein
MENTVEAREQFLATVARILRWGVIANAVTALLVLIAALVAASGAVANLFPTLQGALLFRYGGAADTAVALVILALLVNVSLLLVLMVAVLARELWALVGLVLLVIANVLALALLGFTPAVITLAFSLWALVRLARGMKALRANPVMIRELRGRMRGARAFVVMSIYLALMSGFALLVYTIFGNVSALNASAATGEVGRIVFAGVVGIELLLIIFIAPSFTAGAITGERERQTYDLLRTTLLATPSFITGKLESSLGYILLLLLAAIPLQSIAFLFGGVSETEVLLAFVILAVTAITFGTVGIYFSASQARTLAASVRTYTIIGIFAFVVPLVGAFVVGIVRSIFFSNASAAPLPGFEALLVYANLFLTSLNPFLTAIDTQQLLVGQRVLGSYPQTLISNGATIPLISSWVLFAIIYLATAAVLLVMTNRRTQVVDANA